eukprot:CAMPEP_0119542312 /NCGR_PEP_ID=MMETSP1344-20130328/53508_1 /TAXON_ID=236787 /ORGANISM="Florenciella parvula, Strain CCMP2471" /LENGTH=89 /DNA_ID=CAMNT_0007586507 /DNA_START=221 /DNA_END=488 /DNA_ORIENTATION=-
MTTRTTAGAFVPILLPRTEPAPIRKLPASSLPGRFGRFRRLVAAMSPVVTLSTPARQFIKIFLSESQRREVLAVQYLSPAIPCSAAAGV